jgi:hypothetical protein
LGTCLPERPPERVRLFLFPAFSLLICSDFAKSATAVWKLI